MRITLITATPDTVASGSGTFVATAGLVENLAALGVEVRIIRPPDGRSRHLFNLGLRPSDVLADTDLVVGFDMDGWRLSGNRRCPFIAYLHGVIADEARFERGLTRMRLLSYARAEGYAARRAALVLATSEYSRGQITDLYGAAAEKIRVVQPGTDVERWEAGAGGWSPLASPSLRSGRRLGVTGDRSGCVIFCAAHFYPRKNIGALLRATALLRGQVPGLQARIAGDGPERRALLNDSQRLGIQDTVTFLGHVPFEQLAAEYAACDVFCLPTLQEGFGLVFVEAMAAGKPIVALKAGAVPELVQDGINGTLAPPGDDGALADALRALLADSAARQRMSDVNRVRAREFTARRMAERFLRALEGLTLPSSPFPLP